MGHGVGDASVIDDAGGRQPADEGGALIAEVVELRRQIDRLESQWLRLVADAERAQAFQRSGALSMAGVLRERCGFAYGQSTELLRSACALRHLDHARQAFDSGDIGLRHVQVLTRAFSASRRAAMEQAGLDAGEQEQILTTAARSLDSTRLRRLVEHWAHGLDPDGALDAANAGHHRRRLHLSPMLDGVTAVDGLLDADGAEVVRTAVHALCGPPAPDDDRTPGQRRADALVELARRSLDGSSLPEVAGQRPHVTVTVDLVTLQRRPGARAAESGNGGTLHGEAARRIACDAGITRVITAGSSQPLDVGRSTRSISPALRVALGIRDGGCAHPACDRACAVLRRPPHPALGRRGCDEHPQPRSAVPKTPSASARRRLAGHRHQGRAAALVAAVSRLLRNRCEVPRDSAGCLKDHVAAPLAR